jgi:NAD(P)-dependent dehydrogenase (short-subunit alcohol dehydrogenase family)
MEYAKDGIRVNTVAPGVVDTPLHRETPKEVMESLSPMGRVSTVNDIADAASELLRDVFGQETVSSRLVFGVASLPLGSPVELEVILEV